MHACMHTGLNARGHGAGGGFQYTPRVHAHCVLSLAVDFDCGMSTSQIYFHVKLSTRSTQRRYSYSNFHSYNQYNNVILSVQFSCICTLAMYIAS